MRMEIRELVQSLGVTTLFVTHEQIEALTMSDQIGVMNEGVIVQEGTPDQIYHHPKESFVANFIGKTNFITGKVIDANAGNDNAITVQTSIGILRARGFDGLATGDAARISIRPENVIVALGDGAAENTIKGVIQHQAFLGNIVDCVVAAGEQSILVQLHPANAGNVGDEVSLQLPHDSCVVIRD
jgi:iron(III) transport system ATP-binding protein